MVENPIASEPGNLYRVKMALMRLEHDLGNGRLFRAPLFTLAVLMWAFSPHLILCVETPGHIALELLSDHCRGPASAGDGGVQEPSSPLPITRYGCTDQFVVLDAVRGGSIPVVSHFYTSVLPSMAFAGNISTSGLPSEIVNRGRRGWFGPVHPASVFISTAIIRC